MLRIEATARLKYSRSMSGGGHMAVSVTRESAHAESGDATCTGDDEVHTGWTSSSVDFPLRSVDFKLDLADGSAGGRTRP